MAGKFITLEGGEGVGKSSLQKQLTAWLSKKGISALSTREPGGTEIANQIRRIFLDKPSEEDILMESELCLVSAARAQHVKHVIRPALEREQWVICDRFADSSRVYQQMVGGIDQSTCESVIKMTTYNTVPDLTLILDCDPETAQSRVSARLDQQPEVRNRYDSAHLDLHRSIRKGFLDLAQKNPQRFCVIDAGRTLADSLLDASKQIEARFLN